MDISELIKNFVVNVWICNIFFLKNRQKGAISCNICYFHLYKPLETYFENCAAKYNPKFYTSLTIILESLRQLLQR